MSEMSISLSSPSEAHLTIAFVLVLGPNGILVSNWNETSKVDLRRVRPVSM